jgi:tetratricopeptide (TPR) repeat protein
MGLLDKLRGKKENRKDAQVPLASNSNMIQLFDKSGAPIYISKENFQPMLPGLLKAAQNDPDRLAAIIVGSIQDGFFSDILEAAEHLHSTDPQHSRGTCVYGIVLMKNHRFDDAERLFLQHTQKYGEDSYVLTNLAKIYAERKDIARIDATLWRALELDPNNDNAASWYAVLAYERVGKEGRIDAWRRIAGLPESWRAQLWLARDALESHNSTEALACYRQSLDRVGDKVPADLLIQITGDMGLTVS